MKIKVCIVLLITITTVFTEIYKDILPSDNLATLKQKYPNASFLELHPAWAQKNDKLYQITGSGISGKIIVKLLNRKDVFMQISKELSSESSDAIANCNEECITVEWVRWVPSSKVQLKKLIGKYGKPDSTGYSNDDYTPFNYWRIGLTAYVNDSSNVERIDYEFTYEDEIYEYKLKHNTTVVPVEDDNFIRYRYNKPIYKRDSVIERIQQILFGKDSPNK